MENKRDYDSKQHIQTHVQYLVIFYIYLISPGCIFKVI